MPRYSPLKLIFLAFLISRAAQVQAVRTAVFPDKIRARSAVWVDQDRVFSVESPLQQKRPIWIHAGDSIATGWGSGDTLGDALKKAEQEVLPRPGTLSDLFSHLPDPTKTWYAGEQIAHGGLFHYLEARSSREWVLISTALAGSMLSQNKLNPLRLPLDVKNLDRVKLVTFSIGANDMCSGIDPFLNLDTHPARLLSELKQKLPRDTVYLAFKVPEVWRMYQSITSQLKLLPDSSAKRTLQNYCTQMWEEFACPALTQGNEKISSIRSDIIGTFETAGVKMIDLNHELENLNVLDLFSSDCFHPSLKTQRAIFDATARALDHELLGDPLP